VQRTETETSDICTIPVRCTIPAFIVFYPTNIWRLCRFLATNDPLVEVF
jgi:hypothetical protein